MAGYVTVQATTTNNVYRNGSGGTEEGSVTYHVDWTDRGGFTENGWFFGEPIGTPLETWWYAQSAADLYGKSEEGFINYMISESGPDNLDAALGSWPNGSKIYFLQHHSEFGYDYVTDTFRSSCVREIR